ncbi:MAG: FapA family protein, partial [Thermofilaceae archaeon]
ANLTIDGNLYVKDYLIFSETKVNGELQSIEGKGIIYGGKIYVTKNITLKTAGHSAQTKTEIFAGYKPEIVENYFKLSEKELIFSDNLKKVLYGLELFEKLKTEGKLTPDKERILTKLSIERDKLVKKLYHIKEELKLLREKFEELKSAKIRILQRVYPNVILGIANLKHTVFSELSGPIVFHIEDDQITNKNKKE